MVQQSYTFASETTPIGLSNVLVIHVKQTTAKCLPEKILVHWLLRCCGGLLNKEKDNGWSRPIRLHSENPAYTGMY